MAVTHIELQIISKILTSDSIEVVNTLCSFDDSYYSVFKPHIQFILNHRQKYDEVPDIFTFQAEFPDITLVDVQENLTYLTEELSKNKQHIILIETFNKLKDFNSGDVSEAWQYLSNQCDKVSQLDSTQPLDIVKQSQLRSSQIIEFSQQSRIPTGFDEIDKLMYGGLSTVEELLIIVARTNTGKSWVGTKMMESAQKHGFPVLYYSPEMQGSFLGTRFDTWRGHFENNKLYQGNYNEEYHEYLKSLSKEETSAFILEDKDVSDGTVNIHVLNNLVKKHNIKLLIVDGLSYMEDINSGKGARDYEKYKNLCSDLFKLSKQHGCAVVVMMQANRESKDNKDDKGEVFPNIYNIEGSDHPGRIATQVFAMRQIFDKHVLDIRLEKSRMANNQKPEFSYSWDINTGNMQYIPNDEDNQINNVISPVISNNSNMPEITAPVDIDLDDSDDDVEF
jgi:KaiC/GvpD/RAD55 family RecA-like ATPase